MVHITLSWPYFALATRTQKKKLLQRNSRKDNRNLNMSTIRAISKKLIGIDLQWGWARKNTMSNREQPGWRFLCTISLRRYLLTWRTCLQGCAKPNSRMTIIWEESFASIFVEFFKVYIGEMHINFILISWKSKANLMRRDRYLIQLHLAEKLPNESAMSINQSWCLRVSKTSWCFSILLLEPFSAAKAPI